MTLAGCGNATGVTDTAANRGAGAASGSGGSPQGSGGSPQSSGGSSQSSGGSSQTAGAGSGGSGGFGGGLIDCASPAPTATVDPATVATYRGENGTFTDECDASGNLVQYGCETVLECGPGPNPACTSMQTGNVASGTVDCGGECERGACAVRCPDFEDSLVVLSVESSGAIVIDYPAHERRYECALAFDNPNDALDCTSARQANESLTIETLGVTDAACTAGRFNFGVGSCSYACERVPL